VVFCDLWQSRARRASLRSQPPALRRSQTLAAVLIYDSLDWTQHGEGTFQGAGFTETIELNYHFEPAS